MFKKIIISILVIFLLFPGLITFAFIYSEQAQKIIINSFELKSVINKKVKNYISEKINDKDLIVNASEIKFLEPNWPNLIRFTINKIKIKSLEQEEESSIKFIEIGLSYSDIIKIIFSTKDNLSVNYLDLKKITLTATYENNQFLPGPIIKILSGITYTKTRNRQNFKKILNNKILIEDIKFVLTDKRINFKEHTFLISCENVILS
ncbi:hypothetical protein OAK51_06835, partial [Alphaproteobacteria bacterium]|nr:hypothetical protein [Alphaproteobacteria bacterium]